MSRIAALGFAAMAMFSNGNAFAQNDECDRECLRSALLRYMNAVAANAPQTAGVIVGFRQTENAVVVPLGSGTWQSVTALGEVQRHFLDPVSGQAA
jgi:hypothetical protein